QGLTGHKTVDAKGVARALTEASAVAYRAVMKPTEGTILTVVREAATAATAAAAESDDLRVLLERAVQESHAAVERTIDQLAALREAGVVDAGGFGLAVILEGFTRTISEADDRPATTAGQSRRGEPQGRLPFPEQN